MELSDGSRICLDCEAMFIIEDGERKYFDDHNLTLPRRCRTCRQLRKDLAHQADVEHAKKVLGVVDIQKQIEMIILLELLGEI